MYLNGYEWATDLEFQIMICMLMPSEIEELRKMLEYTMRRYNELLKRVEAIENSNAPIYFVSDNQYDTIT